MSASNHKAIGTERFTKLDDRLIKLGLPLRLALLYGRLAYRAAIGKHDLNHGELAKEIGLGTRQHVQRLLKLLQRLRLIEWKRSRYWNIYRVLDPDQQFIAAHVAPLNSTVKRFGKRPASDDPDVTSTSHLERSRCDLPITSDVTEKSHLDARIKSVGVEEELRRRTPPTPQAPPSSSQPQLPGLCATDVARVGESSLAIIPRTGNAHPRGSLPAGEKSPEWFAAWWAIYWRKVARKAAEKAFQFHVKTPERFAQVMTATLAQTTAMMARAPDKRPCGDSWLKGERWNDEPSAPAKPVVREDRSLKASVMRVIGPRLARGEKPW